MSALAMILTAAMVVPVDGPEKASGELVRESQRLDLLGGWEGIRISSDNVVEKVRMVSFSERLFRFNEGQIIEEGFGRLLFKTNKNQRPLLGIYEQHGDHVRICFSSNGNRRPSQFRAGNGNHLYILHRTESLK